MKLLKFASHRFANWLPATGRSLGNLGFAESLWETAISATKSHPSSRTKAEWITRQPQREHRRKSRCLRKNDDILHHSPTRWQSPQTSNAANPRYLVELFTNTKSTPNSNLHRETATPKPAPPNCRLPTTLETETPSPPLFPPPYPGYRVHTSQVNWLMFWEGNKPWTTPYWFTPNKSKNRLGDTKAVKRGGMYQQWANINR